MKRSMKAILMMLVLLISMSSVALAEEGEALDKGFCVSGSNASVVIEGRTAANGTVGAVSAIPADGGEAVQYFEGAERLRVTYTGAASENDQFMVLLVTGDGLPTKADAICYIDQVAKEGEDVVFDVYPLLPAENTKLTLFITSNRADFTKIAIPMTYAAAGEYVGAGYMPGDVDGDGTYSIDDVWAVIKHIVHKERLNEAQLKAANVKDDKYVDVNDVMVILDLIVGNAVE